MPLQVRIREALYTLHRPSDLESLWTAMEENDFGEDERIPYWVEVWPAAIHLAEWIASRPGETSGRRCLDLGCGLGLCSLVAARNAARVVGMDYERGAVFYTRKNARLNSVPLPDAVLMDWRCCGFKPGSFSLVFAADILYEKRFWEPVEAFLRRVLAPEGKVLLSTPERQTTRGLLRWLQSLGWSCCPLSEKRVVQREYDMEVTLWELRL
ncbi:MAG: methyltransferase domain-containing protein [Desulfohalobiaceae bacterium]|nr:methyltransferase domain-containing protein [Desulfohalobiaceae bacterium]